MVKSTSILYLLIILLAIAITFLGYIVKGQNDKLNKLENYTLMIFDGMETRDRVLEKILVDYYFNGSIENYLEVSQNGIVQE